MVHNRFFLHIIDLIALARKSFRPQNKDDKNVLAEQTDYVWDPEWLHESFINLPTHKSSQAIRTISIQKDYLKYTHLQLTQHL